MIIGCGKLDAHVRTRLDAVERSDRSARARPKKQEPMHFRQHEVGRQEPGLLPDSLAEGGVGFDVVLIARAEERDPGAAIDE